MPVPGRNVAVLVDEFDMSAYFNEFEFEREAERIDVSTFGKLQRAYLAGPQESTVTLTGFYDGGKNQVDDVFHTRFGAQSDILITLCPDTALFGKACYLTPTTEVTYNLSAEVEDAVEIEGEFAVNGAVDRGHILHAVQAETATGNGTAVISDAATNKGGVAHVHVTGVTSTSGGSVVVAVEHSVDGSVWVPVPGLTSSAFTDAGSVRLATAPTETINAQVRAHHTVAGTAPVAAYALAFARGI